MMRVPLDVIGDIAILKFSKYAILPWKKFYAWRLLRKFKNIKVVLEKTSGFSGVLRTQKTRYILGEDRKETLHKENGCLFYLNVDETYFSPRLSEERKRVSEDVLKEIMKNKMKYPKILVLFAGVSPFSIVLAKILKQNKIKTEIISSELNKRACEYGQKNIEANKVDDFVKLSIGDSREICLQLARRKKKFDFVLMPRPNIEDTFLDCVTKIINKNSTIYYHGFGTEDSVKKEIVNSLVPRKTKILDFRKAGDIGVDKYRFNVKFKII